jgi:hypothetical protein
MEQQRQIADPVIGVGAWAQLTTVEPNSISINERYWKHGDGRHDFLTPVSEPVLPGDR